MKNRHKKNPGRKPMYPAGERARFIFVCRKDDRDRWLAKAEAEGVSLGEVIRQKLNEWSKPTEKN